ncbi:hypothetical protein BWD09_11055 [Neisseria dentiae]|uniref:Transposase n=1 Tax=Neisseria dentiae TaxID=194197 RepID=A0A1X3D3D7_9NEIS|nr:IS1 family transposase [Neisseria dentiae]OSI14221.1 hypothetical protein BWD09_11055 [Neisseria dentiae]QMT44714.1 IS1 family transposase [Neisseria dentiae]
MVKIAASITMQGFQRFFANEHKKCPFCHQNTLIKYGRKNGRQRYKCSACQKFLPTSKPLDNDNLLYEYIHLKQTCAQIAKRYQCSAKTIRRRIKQGSLITNKPLKPVANIIMDATYFGRSFGVMVFINQLDGNIIHKQYVIKETAALYEASLTTIMKKGLNGYLGWFSNPFLSLKNKISYIYMNNRFIPS